MSSTRLPASEFHRPGAGGSPPVRIPLRALRRGRCASTYFRWPPGSIRWSWASRRFLVSCVPRTPAPSRPALWVARCTRSCSEHYGSVSGSTPRRVLTRWGASVVSEALAAADEELAGPDQTGLAGRRVLVLGTGSLGGLATAQLHRAGVAEIVLANRTPGSAQRLAARCEAEAPPPALFGLDGVTAALPTVELVLCCTGAGSYSGWTVGYRGLIPQCALSSPAPCTVGRQALARPHGAGQTARQGR